MPEALFATPDNVCGAVSDSVLHHFYHLEASRFNFFNFQDLCIVYTFRCFVRF